MTERAERFVFIPCRLRREHGDWASAEHAAWLDLFLASFELEGRFDSLEVARAFLGRRATALDALIGRGAFLEFDGTWSLSDYLELYDGRRPRHYKTLAQRLADADAREARGEPLLPIERWARWKQRQNVRATEWETEREKDLDKERDGANVEPTLANDPTPMLPRLGNLYEAFTQLTGLPCTPQDRGRIDNLCRVFDRDLVRRAMYADPEPSRSPAKFIGRVFYALKKGAAA